MTLRYTLKKEKRRSLTIQIKEDATVIVKAPHQLSQREIDRFLNEKQPWIEKKLAIQQQRHAQRPTHDFLEGELFSYLGEQYPLRILAPAEAKKAGLNLRSPLDLLSGQFLLHESKSDKASAKKYFIKWYQSEARTVLQDRVEHYTQIAGLKYTDIKLSNARTRWGSCSSRGSLNFNWRIVMAPIEVLDYLVVHEVVHLRHHNHSKHFWGMVEELYPEYKGQRGWLKREGHRLGV